VKRQRLLHAGAPHDCVVLAIDTASNSGWSIWQCGQFYSSGETKVMDHGKLVLIVEQAVEAALGARLTAKQVVLVLERPFAGNAWTQQSLGASRHAWLSAWCEVHGTKVPHRRVLVYPPTWRSHMFRTTKHTLPFESDFGQSMLDIIGVQRAVGPDEAAAICIGKWATTAGEVLKVLPKRRVKAA
jgi:hypothetical protein